VGREFALRASPRSPQESRAKHPSQADATLLASIQSPAARSLVRLTDLPFSSERQGRLRAYHGREESRAQPAASRHTPTIRADGWAFGCCNGLLDGAQGAPMPLAPVVIAGFGVSGLVTVESSARRGDAPFRTAATAKADPGTSQIIAV
jgi:hypothetical protein